MKILCVADHVAPLVYSANIKERFRDVDLVLGAGDLPMNYLGFIASTLNRQVLFVFGNHNLKWLPLFQKNRQFPAIAAIENPCTTNYFGSVYLGTKVKLAKGIIIAGLGGSIRYNGGENQHTDVQMFWKMLRLVPYLIFNKLFRGRYLDILLTHSPPYKLNDRDDLPHTGFKTFRTFIKLFNPRYLLHGHVHLSDINTERVVRFRDTSIINVYGHFVLDF